jgi:Ca2+-transporting ATPase
MNSDHPLPNTPGPEVRDTPAWHALSPRAALDALASDEARGLDPAEVRERLERYGANALRQRRGVNALSLMGRQLASPIVYLLLGSAALAIALGKRLDGAVVAGAVVVNAVIGFFQEFRAGKAIEALSRMVPEDAQVVRGGRTECVPASELVPGDILLLDSGDRVPADVRILHARNLQVEEAALTGESLPAQKLPEAVPPTTGIADRSNMAFGGTLVTSGAARTLVVATGDRTELGRISHLMQEVVEIQTPLTRALASVGRWLTAIVLVISALLFAVSIARGYPLADGVLVAITLAVASIPEGLPAIITIALAIGVQRMAARNAIIRKLPSVETLGSTTVICSDKTGTLTRNEMTVKSLWTPRGSYSLSGVGYCPAGELSWSPAGDAAPARLARCPVDVEALAEAGALASDAAVHGDGEEWQTSGDPTESALVVAAMKVGLNVEQLRHNQRRIDVIPFESEHQFMATLNAVPDGEYQRVFIKGAPEVVLSRCGLAEHARGEVMAHVSELASRGMRVLALASKRFPPTIRTLRAVDAADGFALLGLAGMIDPPRPEAVDAVKKCHSAGITVKMITGDHLGTAEAIGEQLGLLSPGSHGMSGAEIAATDDARLSEAAARTNVFARVAPEHKLRLVKALQERGHVVAMTGDGVNDAPALQQANVGVAMGITGTAVSKEAADIVLADDNFATIAAAVEEGRRIHDNLVKSLAFVLPANLAQGLILTVAVASFPMLTIAGERVPLMPVLPSQLLWVNLVTSVALSVPLAFEVSEPDIMLRPPRPPGTPVFDRFLVLRTLLVASAIAAATVGLFLWEYWSEVADRGHDIALREAQTMAVTTIVWFQIFYLLECRSLRSSLFRIGWFANRAVFAGIAVLMLLQAAFIYLPFLQAIFGAAALQLRALGWSALVASLIVPLIGLEKLFYGRAVRPRRPSRPLAPTELPSR